MKKAYRIKKSARNEFSALSGIHAIEVQGQTHCLIVDKKTHKSVPIQWYAYTLYCEKYNLNKFVIVRSSCGVLNCVKKSHLIANYVPSSEEADYIKTYHKIEGTDTLAHRLDITPAILESYIKLHSSQIT